VSHFCFVYTACLSKPGFLFFFRIEMKFSVGFIVLISIWILLGCVEPSLPLSSINAVALHRLAIEFPVLQSLTVPWQAGGVSDPCGMFPWSGLTCGSNGTGDDYLELYLNMTNLGGPFLTNLTSSITIWRSIILVNCRIRGTIPETLFAQPQLLKLDVSSNNISGSIPDLFGGVPRLKEFLADSNQLTHEIPATLFDLRDLRTLSLSYNALNGSLPKNMGNGNGGTLLRNLRLSWNGDITGSIPSAIGGLVGLVEWQSDGLGLTGSAPDGFCNMTQLETLSVGFNKLSGTLPSCFNRLQNLQYLSFRQNRLEGSLPTCLATNPLLRFFLVQANRFNGTVPPIPAGSRLQRLLLRGNRLTGAFPASIANAASTLMFLDINDNMFTGIFPSNALLKMPNLVEFDASGNNLTGCFYSSSPLSTCSLANNTRFCDCGVNNLCDVKCAQCSTLTCSLTAVAQPPQCSGGGCGTTPSPTANGTVIVTHPVIITGDLIIPPNTTLEIELGGGETPITVTGCAEYAGTLQVSFIDTFIIATGANFTLVTLSGCQEDPTSRFSSLVVDQGCKTYAAELEYSAVSLNLILGSSDESQCRIPDASVVATAGPLSIGAIAGIAVAGAVLVVLVSIGIIILFRTKIIPAYRAEKATKRRFPAT
jgi:Leucine-rich repeat (LRR) protein